jgi:LAS superfamily LD-carboxypeptidase LdcB
MNPGNPVPASLARFTNGRLPGSQLATTGDGEQLWSTAARQFRRMDAAARAAGLDLHINSGYRSYQEQAVLYNRYRNHGGPLAAAPGHGNHGWGLSADIDVTNPQVLRWLRSNAARFGFFPDVGLDVEPWHWTYRPR